MYIWEKEANGNGLTKEEINNLLALSVKRKELHKVLIIPPDFTRFYSNAGYNSSDKTAFIQWINM